ncbi:MAG TPA: DNA recombination protein RmuC [Candidatus Paceibacterota bacterium]|jgi:DNA recombination protein RmuC|nr:DNA recombination protein RmuC [Parcubacteria group bacterium]MDP6119572.1 DNA recombination protein RmuC [Candidatus Paceibacterota bacterium]HJN62817.1 DNA recombination protein RmuC [Candidatus Paceibacterota bacterium]|tara:strand:+ start:1535 stop:2566 length:1032 start_codon:yes stop_codon:yes gene_type:complete
MLTNVILIFGFILLGFLIWWFNRKDGDGADSNSFLMLQTQLNELTKTMDQKIGETTKQIQSQSNEANRIVRDVVQGLTKLEETNKNVLGFADQLQNLQDVLKNPKQRGVLGEYYLETVLKNVLPPDRFKMQYKFDNGEIVDAVIFLEKGKILPIDSKFSLENYNKILEEREQSEREKLEKAFRQDLKNRINETSKYIRPKEGTMDFAFMFIPSEGIYYDLLVNQVGAVKANTRDLIEYAFQQKKVIIVSPTSFMAYLQTVLQGLRALQIEESAKEIRQNVEVLGRHVANYDTFLGKLGSSLGTTVNHYNTAHKELKKIDKDVLKISGTSAGVEPLEIGKPGEE